MSYPWFAGAPNSLPGLENAAQNGSLTHSPATVSGGTDSPGTTSHHASGAAGNFPSTSPYPTAVNTSTSQQSSESHSQSPHGLSHTNPASFLSSFGENALQQHLYSASSRFGPFVSEGVSSSDQNFPFGMSSQMLPQAYSMRSQAYAGMPGYGDSSQQEMSRLNAYGASPYSTPGLENYYSHFDSRQIPGASQSTESMFSAADRLSKTDFENGVPRPSTNPWPQFGAEGRDGLYLQPGYTSHPMGSYGSPLGPMFHANSHYRPLGYESPHYKSEVTDPYGLASPAAMGPRFSPPQMMYNRDKKSPKKPDTSPVPKPATNVDDSPPVPNKAAKYFSERGIFIFHPPDTGPAIGPYASMMITMADRYIMCQKMLCQRLSDVDLPPKVTYVYNPLEYAFETHYKFVKKYYNTTKRILFLGMNPGPFGMSQNGVPFGECNIVTDWMEIVGEVNKPVLEHPKRPVMGMECKRSEVSGARFWELFRRLCPTAEGFFKNCAIHNLCPLAFMTETGKNVAPSDMPVKVLRQLDSLCDQTFLDVVALFKVDHVITIGKYAYTCAQKAMSTHGVHGVQLHCMMHPSPANPSANKGWADIAENQLREFGVYSIIATNPQPPPQPQPPAPPPQPQPQPSLPQSAQPQPPPSLSQQQHQQQHPHQHPQQHLSPSSHLPHPSQMHQHPHQHVAHQVQPHSNAAHGGGGGGYPGNPYGGGGGAHHPHTHPHLSHLAPSNHHLAHHHNPHHPLYSPSLAAPHSQGHHYPVPHVLQSTGGMNPVPIGGMGGGGDMGGMGDSNKRTHDIVADGNHSGPKRVKLEEA